jgi:predicted metal-dependent hydrolase
MENADPADSDAVRAAKRRRIELKRALSDVEVAAAAPAPDANWRNTLLESLEQLKSALEQHAEEVESAGGLLDEIVDVAPRLHKRVVQQRREHGMLIDQTLAAITATRTGRDVGEVRAQVLDALIAIARHRQHGSDLVYDAYMIDIGTP